MENLVKVFKILYVLSVIIFRRLWFIFYFILFLNKSIKFAFLTACQKNQFQQFISYSYTLSF